MVLLRPVGGVVVKIQWLVYICSSGGCGFLPLLPQCYVYAAELELDQFKEEQFFYFKLLSKTLIGSTF